MNHMKLIPYSAHGKYVSSRLILFISAGVRLQSQRTSSAALESNTKRQKTKNIQRTKRMVTIFIQNQICTADTLYKEWGGNEDKKYNVLRKIYICTQNKKTKNQIQCQLQHWGCFVHQMSMYLHFLQQATAAFMYGLPLNAVMSSPLVRASLCSGFQFFSQIPSHYSSLYILVTSGIFLYKSSDCSFHHEDGNVYQ